MYNKLIKELIFGFVKIHILYHAGKEPIFGQEFREELKRHGYEISFGTLYPIFHRLEKDGFIISYKEKVKGKIRKYYKSTTKGRKVLSMAKIKAKELVNEILELH